MRTTKLLPTLVALTLLAGLVTLPAVAAPSLQGGNLLTDPAFDMAAQGNWKWGWWFYENIVNQADNKKLPDLDQSFYSPSFMPSEPKWDHESGGQSGAAAALSGKQYTKFRAGFYQSVDVPAGSKVRFSIWVNEYCQDDKGNKCPVVLKAGIDPNGDTNWQSGNIQWVGTEIVNNKYLQLTTDEVTVGPNNKVTVYTWGEPRFPVLYDAAYFDDASLVVTQAAAATPTGAPPTAAPAQPVQPAQPAQPASCAQLRWAADVTVPDGTVMAPNAQFVKTWRVKNNGTCTFSGTLNFIGKGNQMGGVSPATLPTVEPGQQADMSINLTAPAQTGDYQGTWQPRTSDGTPMENLVVRIKVSADAATQVPGVTATPEGQVPTPAATPTPTTGQICVLAYNDRNGNGQQDSDENLLAGVVFTLADTSGPRDSYTTDGVSEPHCFTDLPPGSYQLGMKAPANYTSTTSKTMVIALNGGMQTDVAHGARRGGPAPTPTRTDSSGGGSAAGLLGSAARVVLIVVAVLVLIGLGFVGGFVLLSRR